MKSHGPKVKWVTPIVPLIRNIPVLRLTRNSFCTICSFCKRINWIELQDRKRKSWLGAGRLEGGGLSSTITKELAPQMLNSLVKNGGPGHRHNIFFYPHHHYHYNDSCHQQQPHQGWFRTGCPHVCGRDEVASLMSRFFFQLMSSSLWVGQIMMDYVHWNLGITLIFPNIYRHNHYDFSAINIANIILIAISSAIVIHLNLILIILMMNDIIIIMMIKIKIITTTKSVLF